MNRIHFFALALCFFALSACDSLSPRTQYPTPNNGPFGSSSQPTITQTQTMQTRAGRGQSIMDDGTQRIITIQQASGKIAILLPLSGAQKNLGQAMLQAAQLAIFDMGDTAIELIPLDTRGTPDGATNAVHQAAKQEAKIIIGPLLANNVQAAGQTARQYNLNVIGFTTDWTKAGGNVFTIGILPFDQGQRLAQYAAKKRINRVLALSNNNPYSNAVLSSFRNAASPYGIQIAATVQNNNIATLAQNHQSFDAVLIPYGGIQAIQTVKALQQAGFGHIPKMGTGLWDDNVIKSESTMIGSVFSAPSNATRKNFEQNYRSLYGQLPPRLSSLAYDATALTIVMLRQNNAITPAQIMNPNGFAGIDGIFRFGRDGRAQRGLAIHKLTGYGKSVIVDQAPNSF
jgi:branched-chain amino acid transport system substrate-binding protein